MVIKAWGKHAASFSGEQMKTVFIINPCAGKKNDLDSLIESIKGASCGRDVTVYLTKSPGDATGYVKSFCAENGGGRFIACGGDGTLNEVLNGVIGYEGAEVGVIPVGTGNDFCRNFGRDYDFFDIPSIIDGTGVRCDAIRYTNKCGEGYCLNMFNIGFDCNVADMTSEIKKKPFISGSFAYFVSILLMLIKKKGAELRIELDGEVHHDGKLLLTSVANGSYCGGGIKSNPLADITDGLININIIKNVSRLRFLTLLPYYMKGTVLEKKGVHRFIASENCKSIRISPKGGKMRLCVDGEITDADETVFEIIHNAFTFVLPGAKLKEDELYV